MEHCFLKSLVPGNHKKGSERARRHNKVTQPDDSDSAMLEVLENAVDTQLSAEEAMLRGPVPVRPRHFTSTGLDPSQEVPLCDELVADPICSGPPLCVS